MVKRCLSYGIALCVLPGIAAAQSVDLRGMVHDRFSSRPISQAKVALAHLGHQAFTDSSGRFHILPVPTRPQGAAAPGRLALLPGGRLAWHAPQPGDIAIELHDPSGGMRWQGRYALPQGGDWELGIGALPPGLYVAVLAGRGFRHAARVVLLGQDAGTTGAVAPARRRPVFPLAKGAAAVDTLIVTRDGYRPFSLPLASLEESGLVVGLSDTTVSLARLVRLGISEGKLEPEFSPDALAYHAYLRQAVQSLRVTPEAASGLPAIRVNGVLVASGSPSAALPLSLGRNEITVAVTSEDGASTLSYALEAHRAYDDSAALSYLMPSLGTLVPAFHPEVFAYSLQLPGSVSQLALSAAASQPLCSLSLNGKRLLSGEPSSPQPLGIDSTILTVSVASPNLARQVRYQVLVRRQPAADDATLKSLSLSPGHPGMKPFHHDTLEYVMHVEPWDSVYGITASARHPSATLAIRGTAQAAGVERQVALTPEWSNWYIDVTSADGSKTRRYNVTFFRQIMLPAPTLAGPNVVTVGAPARFSATSLGVVRCGEFDTRYRMATGSGDTVTTRHADSIPFAWSAPGIYTVRVQSICLDNNRPEIVDGKSPWSSPKLVTVESGDGASRVRRISGVRNSPETWSPDTTYIIEGNTRFDSSALLTLLPGTWVMFSGPNTYLEVTALSAVGTAQDSIHFVGGVVRLLWNGPLSYRADGSYAAGPRFEYCSLQDVRLAVIGDTASQGGFGPYLKNSYVKTLTGDTAKLAVGTYMERCRIEGVDGMRLFESRILNSHLGITRIIADPGGTTQIRRCDIHTLSMLSANFQQADIAGNTIRRFSANYPSTTNPGKLSGNNIHSTATLVVTLGGSPVDMRGNWWGEAVTAEMVAKGTGQDITVIQDGFDEAARAKADYGGWLTAPVPGATPDW